MVRLLCVGDLHLGPSDPRYDWERPECEVEPDLVVSIGDVVDDNADHASDAATGRDYEARGRAFYEYLDEAFACPVLAVPGNHDPVACTARLVEGLDSVTLLHEQAVTTAELGVDAGTTEYTLAGWGAEQFDLTPTFDYLTYDALDPRTQATDENFARRAATCAADVESTVARYLLGECPPQEAAAEVGIATDERERFAAELEALEADFRAIRGLLATDGTTPLLFAHEPPFNVSFDVPRGSSHLHTGSLPLKLALVDTTTPVVFCGHYHTAGLDVITAGCGHTYVSNLGSPGVVTARIEPGSAPEVDHRTDE